MCYNKAVLRNIIEAQIYGKFNILISTSFTCVKRQKPQTDHVELYGISLIMKSSFD